jgi:N-acetylmuramoyl-L-alanine amidase
MKIVKLNLIFLLLIPFFVQSTIPKKIKQKFIVVLDAGHGGEDPGNIGNGYLEKEIVLTITLEIGKLLSKDREIKVIYTRKNDKYVELNKRAQIANDANADLFISIHCDAFPSSKAYGAGTFVLGLHENDRNFRVAQKENSVIFMEDDYEKKYDGFDPNNPESVISLLLMQEEYLEQSILAATSIQNSFVSVLKRKDRTVKQAGFLVLRNTYMPSVLVEAGFLTNKKEGAYLNSSKGQNSIAKAVSKAIIEYKNNINKSIEDFNVYNDDVELKVTKKISYKVQIAASKNKIGIFPYNFKGLKPIHRIKNGMMYRYYYGDSKKHKNAKIDLSKAIKRGFKTAFLVAFLNGNSISIEEAKKNE